VTLCADEVLYLPVTTEITSLPQLTPEGLPLALARRAAEETRMAKAARVLEQRCEAVTSRALAAAAHISLNTACTWLRQREKGTLESTPALSVLQYSTHSVSDNMRGPGAGASIERPEDAPAPGDPPAPAPGPLACPAASHRLLWHSRAGA
jgi:hypothetical protein